MSILQQTMAGGVLILAITAFRALLARRLPRFTFMALWILTAVRLLAPFRLPSRLSLYSWLGGLRRIGANTMLVLLPQSYAAPAAETSLLQTGGRMLWLTGAALLAVYFGTSYCRCRRRFRSSLPAESKAAEGWRSQVKSLRRIDIRVSDQITSPLTYGMLRPVILLPKSMGRWDETALDYVLRHEYVHIRRLDAAIKLLLAGALCVHWFNPLVWMMYFLANRDMELSCDEAVLYRADNAEKAAYALALLQLEESRGAPLCSHFSKNAIEERICAIMKMKKFSAFALVFALMLVVSVTAVFATSSVNQAPEGHLKAAGQYTLDENGKIVLDQEDIAGLLDENDDGPVVFVVDEDGNYSVYQYDFIPDDSGNNWSLDTELTNPREYTDEEMQQIIADIESGKIEGFSLTESGKLEGFSFPDQGEDGYSFITYSEYCYGGEDDAE